jgi:hypothetical protein
MKTRIEVENMEPNQLVSWFMIGGYAYYELGDRVMDDIDFDYLVIRLKRHWDSIDHPHKGLITESHLDAATAYDIDYPTIAKCTAWNYLREWNESR